LITFNNFLTFVDHFIEKNVLIISTYKEF